MEDGAVRKHPLELDLVLDVIMKFLYLPQWLKTCRSVNHKWKEAATKRLKKLHLEKFSAWLPYNFLLVTPRIEPSPCFLIAKPQFADYPLGLENKAKGGNPFAATGTAELSQNKHFPASKIKPQPQNTFCVGPKFKLYGDGLSAFSLCGSPLLSPLDGLFFIKILAHMPNLKYLNFENVEVESAGVIQANSKLFESANLVSKVTHLSCTHSNHLLRWFLLKLAKQLESLVVKTCFEMLPFSLENYPIADEQEVLPFSKLNQLSFEMDFNKLIICNQGQLSMPLHRLSVSGLLERVSYVELHNFISRFSTTLVELAFDIDLNLSLGNLAEMRQDVNFTELRKFYFKIPGSEVGTYMALIQKYFLCKFSNIQVIEVYWGDGWNRLDAYNFCQKEFGTVCPTLKRVWFKKIHHNYASYCFEAVTTQCPENGSKRVFVDKNV